MVSKLFRKASVLAAAVALGLNTITAIEARDGDGSGAEASREQQRGIDPNKPQGHFSVPNPADLSPEKAQGIHDRIGADMASAYRLSGHPVTEKYRRWRKFNRVPFISATHGQRYVNVYGNGPAGDYADLVEGSRLPEGAILAKESFSVSETGAVHSGPLFIMEKMTADFDALAGDWRYTMIMPDGSLFGITQGEKSEQVEFCIPCHAEMSHQDSLFLVPDTYRAPPPTPAK